MSYDKIKFKHGLRSYLPSSADIGEPLYCMDTRELFIGTGEGITPVGIVGPKGDKGDPGLNGRNGIDGKDGARGQQGLKGARGDIGPQGIQGERGERGPKGDPGGDGRDGINGATGAIGPQGKTGPQGPQGVQGPKGDKGDAGKSIAIKGQKTTTSELPSSGVENEGWIIQGDLHVWDNTTRNWINIGRVQGPQGEKGEVGERGPAGPVNISDSLESQSSNVAASSKAVAILKTTTDSLSEKLLPKGGGNLTGPVAFQGAYGAEWSVGRVGKSRIFWNANAQSDYGMQFEVDGQSNFKLQKNQTPSVYIDGKWEDLVKASDLKSISTGGDFVDKKLKTGTFKSNSLNSTLALSATINKTGTENILVLTAISGYAGKIKIVIDGLIVFDEDYVMNIFGCDADNNDSGNPLVLPFQSQIQIYTAGTGNSYGASSCSFRWMQYYKQ